MKNRQNRASLFDPFVVKDIWQRNLDEDLQSVSPISPKEWRAFCECQKFGASKKFPPTAKEGSKERRSVAVQKFLDIATHLRDFEFLLPEANLLRTAPYGAVSDVDRALVRARSVCHQILSTFSTERWFDLCRHGPNSSLGVPFDDSGCSRKFLPPFTSTESVVGLFESYLHYDQLLAKSLEVACPDIHRQGGIWKYVDLVESSRLTTVPKNDKTDRTIAIEPTLNMFFQQGLGRYISELLVPFGVDIKVQQAIHRNMAHEASITRNHATIDFSSASDTVGTTLLEFLLPPIWFSAVERIRAPSVLVEGNRIDLSCIATMGNATTFVLETLVFFSLAVAAVANEDKSRSAFPEWECFSTVSVFGDDCIVPSKSAPFFIELCEGVGFIVNVDKTFSGEFEPFRESCGADFFGGYNIRPVLLTGPRSMKPSCLRAWLYTLWNLTCKRLITSLGPRNYVYSRTLGYLASLISSFNKEVFLVDEGDPEDCGVKTFGDWVRLRRLFTSPVGPFMIDANNTLRYKRLISAAPKDGTFTPEVELWLRLKFPSRFDPLDPPSSTSRNVKKSDRGYVVGWGLSFSETLYGVCANYAH